MRSRIGRFWIIMQLHRRKEITDMEAGTEALLKKFKIINIFLKKRVTGGRKNGMSKEHAVCRNGGRTVSASIRRQQEYRRDDQRAARPPAHPHQLRLRHDRPGARRAGSGRPGPRPEGLAALRQLREEHPHLELLISVGGWDYSTYFSDAASTASRRETFAQSCLDLILAHDLDGVDLDWEYPVSGGVSGVIHRPQDKQNFTLLTEGYPAEAGPAGAEGRPGLPAYHCRRRRSGYLNCIEPQAVAQVVDHIFLMTYDFYGPWSSRSGFNAPLYAPSSAQSGSVDNAVTTWLSRGVAAEKLVLGMPLYGYIYQASPPPAAGSTAAFPPPALSPTMR